MNLGIHSVGLLCLVFVARLEAGEFFSDFDSGVPLGGAVYGHALVGAGGGDHDSGALFLTTAQHDQLGTFIVGDLDNGRHVAGFDVRFKMAIFNGQDRGADGVSFSFGSKLSHTLGETGNSSGLVLSFHTYIDGGKGMPQFTVRYNKELIASNEIPQIRTQQFIDTEIKLETNGMLTVNFDHNPIINYIEIPGFKPVGSAQYGFGARTGRYIDNHFIDDLYIVTAVSGSTIPTEEKIAARIKKKSAFAAERFFFLSDGTVMQGYLYKPEGKGPFPTILFHGRESSPLPEAGRINPSPRLAELFTGAKMVLCVPIEPSPDATEQGSDADQSLLERAEAAARHSQAALAWLRTQSFVDPKRILLAGDRVGANTALLVAAQEKEIRGTILFSPEAALWSKRPALQERYVAALKDAPAPALLLQPANLDTIDGFFALRSVIESKGEPNDSRLCQAFGQGIGAFRFATDGVELWKKDVLSFLTKAFANSK